jgi:hypothetical protein
MAENKKFKEAVSGDVVKLDKEGASVAGVLIGYEESKMFPGSYAVKLRNPAKETPFVVFVSNIVIQKIKDSNIQIGQDLMIEFTGMKKSASSGMEYKDYKVFYA